MPKQFQRVISTLLSCDLHLMHTYAQQIKFIAYSFLSIFFLSACTANYTKSVVQGSLASVNLADAHQHQRSVDWVLSSSTPMCLNRSGNRDTGVHNRSLLALDAALLHNMQQAFPNLTVTKAHLSIEQAVSFARLNHCEVLLNPVLVRNKNNLNSIREISEGADLHPGRHIKPDEVAISLEILEARTGRLLDVAVLSSRQKYFAANDKQPADLYEEAVRRYVYNLTGRQPS